MTEGSINPFIDNIADFFIKKFGISQSTAGILIPILYVGLVPFSLILGKLIESYPAQKRNLMILSKAMYVVVLVWISQMKSTD